MENSFEETIDISKLNNKRLNDLIEQYHDDNKEEE